VKNTKELDDHARARRILSEWGKIGGRIGGKSTAANMTPEQRRERAIKANAASQESKRRKKAEREAAQ